MKVHSHGGGHKGDSLLDMALEAKIESLIARRFPGLHGGAFPWVSWKAWAPSARQARRLATAEGIRTTRIGRTLYGHRDDLIALAGRNVVEPPAAMEAANDDASLDDVSPDVIAAFAIGGRR